VAHGCAPGAGPCRPFLRGGCRYPAALADPGLFHCIRPMASDMAQGYAAAAGPRLRGAGLLLTARPTAAASGAGSRSSSTCPDRNWPWPKGDGGRKKIRLPPLGPIAIPDQAVALTRQPSWKPPALAPATQGPRRLPGRMPGKGSPPMNGPDLATTYWACPSLTVVASTPPRRSQCRRPHLTPVAW